VYSTPYTLLSEKNTRPDAPVFRFDAIAGGGTFFLPLSINGAAKLTITDSAGRRVKEMNLIPGMRTINLNLPRGTYSYSIQYQQGRLEGKLVIY